MINSRSLNDLHPYVKYLAEELIEASKEHGIDLLITSTYRDFESQNAYRDWKQIGRAHV